MIDKDALVAEIERRKIIAREKTKIASDNNNVPVTAFWSGKENICNELLSFLDTLEVKEVDLEKEISFQWSKFCLNDKDKDSFVKVAKHFFELGLRVNNEKEKRYES